MLEIKIWHHFEHKCANNGIDTLIALSTKVMSLQ